MQLEWIYHPITQYTVTGVGLIASLSLWAASRSELRRVRNAMNKSVSTLTSSIEEVRNLQAERQAEPPPPAPAPVPFLQGLNLTKRTQILRMQRRGEGLHSIAAALQLPVGEVELTLKMERLQPVPEPERAKSAARGSL